MAPQEGQATLRFRRRNVLDVCRRVVLVVGSSDRLVHPNAALRPTVQPNLIPKEGAELFFRDVLKEGCKRTSESLLGFVCFFVCLFVCLLASISAHHPVSKRSKYIYIPRTQMTHILEDSTHKIEGQPPKKEVSWGLGIHIYFHKSVEHLKNTTSFLSWMKPMVEGQGKTSTKTSSLTTSCRL